MEDFEKNKKELIEERKELDEEEKELREKRKLLEERKRLIREKESLEKKEDKLEIKKDRLKEKKDLIEERKKKIFGFFRKQKEWTYYVILGFIVLLSVYIRTRNIPKLKDVTTGTWTLGPDLDPFLFLRWVEYIAEHGSLMAIDYMRYVPKGFNTSYEMLLHPYMIVWFHKVLSFFSMSDNVTYSAIIFPVFMAVLTAIAFFLFARKVFYKEDRVVRNIIALIATLFFVLIPSLLTRTIAGIPEKESAAFFFMFMAFYLFLEAMTSEKFKEGLTFGLGAGIMTGFMALVWGGFIFVVIAISSAIFISFILGRIKWKKLLVYLSWLIPTFLLMVSFSTKYTPKGFVSSPYTTISLVVFFIVAISLFLIKKNFLNDIKVKTKLPKEIFYSIFSVLILIILILIIFGPSFIVSQFKGVSSSLITPMTTRFGLTVAENRQPYFINDWKSSFGPIWSGIPLYFWLFFVSSILMFNHMIKKLKKKEKIILTFSYFIFLTCLIFSRYSPNHVLNGISNSSLFVYFGGILFFLGCSGYFYYKKYKEREFSIFKEFNFAYILYFLILMVGIVGARGGIRLIMVLGAVSPIAISFLIVKISQRYFREKDETMKFFMAIITILIVIASVFTLWTYYKQDKYTGENFAPSGYNQQWQKAMRWVRENTPKSIITEKGFEGGTVFAHWWDYGYWVQSIGERATILDGGNNIIYWNHLLGRHVLTGTNEKNALEFLYAHNGTHLLIDSTDIGKYTAYSSIGADENYDRFSWISNFVMDNSQTQETKDKTKYIYVGGTSTDEDIIWEENSREIFLPKKRTGIGAIILEKDNEKDVFYQPKAIFVYNNQQYNIPLKYMYYNNKLYDFKSGLDAGIFIYPQMKIEQNNVPSINKIGALLYLSKRTIHSNLANLYLFNKDSKNFKVAHIESNLIIENLKQQVPDIGEFVQYQGFQGPIKIWEINYPENIEFKKEYLETQYPDEALNLAKPGEYN